MRDQTGMRTNGAAVVSARDPPVYHNETLIHTVTIVERSARGATEIARIVRRRFVAICKRRGDYADASRSSSIRARR